MKYKKINSDEQYNLYGEIHEKLTLEGYDKHKDELELIEILLEEYESREMIIDLEMDPVQFLEYILKEEKISKSTLAKELEVSRQLITDITMYRRTISKEMINKLCERFKMQPIAFSRPYDLKNNSKNKAHQPV